MRANDLQWHRLRDRGVENGIFCSPGTQLKYSIDALVSEWVSEWERLSRDGTATSAAARGPFPCNNVATANISEHIWEWRRRRRHFFPALVSPPPPPASSFSFKPIRSWTFCGSVQKRQRFCVACCHCCCGGCCSVLCALSLYWGSGCSGGGGAGGSIKPNDVQPPKWSLAQQSCKSDTSQREATAGVDAGVAVIVVVAWRDCNVH